MVSDDEDLDCPLCMEEFDIADRNFRPCPCGYQICRFCWHHIKSNLNGRCPACRRQYSDQIVQFIPVSADEIVRLKKEKKEKERQHKDMKDSSRRHLSNVRVVQKNLVYVLGLSSKYASMEHEFFKKYGKIAKLVVSKRSTTQQSGNQSSVGIYVTYCRKEDAADAIEGINGSTCEGRSLRASYGTTKYCTYYLRHMSCPNPNCMYLHEPGEDVDSYTKDNLNIGKHPSGSGNQMYPNKRLTPTCSTSTTTANTAAGSSTSASTAPPPATATQTTQVPTKPLARPSTSNDALPAEPPRKSAWAPIPKVVPPPPPPLTAVPEPVVRTPEPEPEPEPEIQPKIEPEPKFEPVVPKKQKQQQREREREREQQPQSLPSPPSQRQESRDIQQPKPSTSGSVSEIHQQQQTKGKNVLEKVSKPIAIENKPALPATASWGKGTNNLSSSHESAATPINFGPSLSDALTAAQKPKHSPSIPRKKEKKLKSKMIRLEDFEEGLRSTSGKATKKQQQKETTTVSSRPAESALSAQIRQQESPWKPIQIPAQGVKPISEPTQQSEHEELPAAATAAPSIQPETTIKEKEKTSPIVENMITEEHQVETRVEQKPQAAESKRPVSTEANEEDVTAVSEGEEDVQQQVNHYEDIRIPSGRPEDEDEGNKRRDSSADAVIPVEDKTAALDQYKSSPDTVDQPSFANYILGSVMLDNDDRTSEDAFDMEGGLSSLKGDLDSEYDAMAAAQDEEFHQQQRLNALDEFERSEKIQEDEHHHHNHGFTSPLLAMEQFSALINQELVQNSPERPVDEFDRRPIIRQQQQQHPPSTLFQDLGLPFDQHQQNQGQQQPPPHQQRAHGPPPGIHGPPEWRSHHFDPFNGQDPAAARRLQHSQQMLEASGLFPGFPPRPPPMFGVSPDFHGGGGTPPPPPPPQGPPPPPGMFGPPPPPPGMMHRPEFMNMPPGLNPPPAPMVDNSDMGNLEQGLHDMNLQQQLQHNHHQNNNDSLRTMQDNLRALLPNVNISFGPMRPAPGPGSVEEGGMIPPPNNKPHTPSHDEPEFLIQRRPSEHVHPRFDFNQVSYNGEFSSPSREHAHFNSTMSPQRNEEKVFISSNGVPHHKPDAYPEHEHQRIREEQQGVGTHDVKQDAQNFFGEFLRKAAASTGPGNPPLMHQNVPLEEVPRKASLPFQDPAIMSMRMSGEKKTPDMTESQNTILQILGGQQQPPQQQQQHQQQQGETMLLNQAMRSPPEDIFAREIPPKPYDMFTEQHQHPPPPMPFHHHQPPPPPPPPFMSGFMGGMPPPPHHPHHHHQFHHMQDQPPPGMMPMQPPPQQQQQQQPIPLQMQMEMEMGYRARNGSVPGGNFPPGLFPNTNTNNNGGGRFDGM